MQKTILITGASGFVGSHVRTALLAQGHELRALVRRPGSAPGAREFTCTGLDDSRAITAALKQADAVVHLAARVHVMREQSPDPLASFRHTNVRGTRHLAILAADAGVTEFLFASSVKAVGEANTTAWREDAPALPVDPYGVSKLEAERAIAEISTRTGMRTTAFRLPLVYGAGVGGNMLRLFDLVNRGWPLPLGGIDNRRSLVYVGNVAAAMADMLGKTRVAETFFVSDDEHVSTPELVVRIAAALGRKVRLVRAPRTLFGLTRWLGGSRTAPALRRLTDSLTVDSSALLERRGAPLPYTLDEGLATTAEWFRSAR